MDGRRSRVGSFCSVAILTEEHGQRPLVDRDCVFLELLRFRQRGSSARFRTQEEGRDLSQDCQLSNTSSSSSRWGSR
jgi:hypothetical protein